MMRVVIDAELGRKVHASERRAHHGPKGADGRCLQQSGRGFDQRNDPCPGREPPRQGLNPSGVFGLGYHHRTGAGRSGDHVDVVGMPWCIRGVDADNCLVALV